jgi:hypothetical protein
MRHLNTRLGLIAALALTSGCTSGQSNSVPGFTSVNLNSNKAQLVVGVATFVDGSKGLNAVETFRQPNGLSATLANTPSIVGPAGFLVPAGSGGTDGGTNHITGSPQVPFGTTAVKSTFDTSGGAFSYGFAPQNSTASGSPTFSVFDGAAYDASGALTGADSKGNPVEFRGGPPTYPNVRTGTFPAGFTGYIQGFATFAATPVVGSYGFTIAISSSNTAGGTIVGTPGTLANATGLGAVTAPAFAPDGAGGGTATCTTPAGTTETLVDLTDIKAGTYYTVVAQGAGPVSATFAPNLGPIVSGTSTPTIATGHEFSVSCIAVDYPAFEAGPPGNLQQTPTIVGAAAQADISFSPNTDAVY